MFSELDKSKLLKEDRVFWTAGRRSPTCPKKTEWCSPKLGTFVRDSLNWNNQEEERIKSCVALELGNFFNSLETKLAMAHCSQRKPIICEVKQDFTVKKGFLIFFF